MIRARFSFYYPGAPSRQLPPHASYRVEESDNPEVKVGASLSVDELILYGIEIPETPAYTEWIKAGSIIYRGKP